jgi:hypothetical protein
MQVVLNSIKENDFHDAFVLESGMWRMTLMCCCLLRTNNVIAAYLPKETILKEMAAKIE